MMDERHDQGGKGGSGTRAATRAGRGRPAAGGPASTEGRPVADEELLARIFNLGRKIQSLRRPSPESLLSESEFIVLSALQGAGGELLTMKQLSERAGMPPSLISRTVNGLEERKGYVERLPSRQDRRQVHIRLTAEGERTLRKYIKRRIERLRILISQMGDEERKVVWRSVEIFEAILERTQT